MPSHNTIILADPFTLHLTLEPPAPLHAALPAVEQPGDTVQLPALRLTTPFDIPAAFGAGTVQVQRSISPCFVPLETPVATQYARSTSDVEGRGHSSEEEQELLYEERSKEEGTQETKIDRWNVNFGAIERLFNDGY